MNGTSKPNGLIWTNAPGGTGYSDYTAKHTFIDKVAVNEDEMLQAVCKQVNRNWTMGDNIIRTVDTFWLPGCDLMKSAGFASDEIKDIANGMCEEVEFSKHTSPAFINGCQGFYSNTHCWLRSAYAATDPDDEYVVACLCYDGADFYDSTYRYSGVSPACSIG